MHLATLPKDRSGWVGAVMTVSSVLSMEASDLANKNAVCPCKSGFQIPNAFFSMSTKKILILKII